jgi:hypothetical protein
MYQDEDNDGKFPDESPVEVRYPRSKHEEQGDREEWPWLGSVLGSASREPHTNSHTMSGVLGTGPFFLARRGKFTMSATPRACSCVTTVQHANDNDTGCHPAPGGGAGHVRERRDAAFGSPVEARSARSALRVRPTVGLAVSVSTAIQAACACCDRLDALLILSQRQHADRNAPRQPPPRAITCPQSSTRHPCS